MAKFGLPLKVLTPRLYYSHTRNLFLISMSIVYTFAFASLYWQQAGLYSENGILPLRQQIKENNQALVVKLARLLNWTPYRVMELVLLTSIILSSLMTIFKCLRTSFTFALLWFGYYACLQVAGLFLYFQWDTLLLEAGFLTIIVAPLRVLYWKRKKVQSEDFQFHDRITMWLVRWLAFRLLFASGLVKLTGGDQTWWALTATTFHYQSQCIPTPLSYYAHMVPAWLHKLSTALVYMFMSGTGILFFSPFRLHRLFAFVVQTSLQITIALTGNYNFFNLLTIILCFGLIDDKFLGYSQWKSTEQKPRSTLSRLFTLFRWLTHLIVFGLFIYLTVRWFDIHWDSKQRIIATRITFTRAQFDLFLQRFIPICLFVAWCSLTLTIIKSMVEAIRRPSNIYTKIFHSLSTLGYSILALSIFFVSMVPFTVIERHTAKALPNELQEWYGNFQQYHIFNAYGLFRSMTGVDGRPELIIEGAMNMKNPKWKEYEFFYKPGSLSSASSFVAPHQPRVDWQMWFAALSNYQHEPWLAFFLYRLLTNQPEVLRLIQTNPFPNTPPKQIRVLLYRYNFTSPPSPNYWNRELITDDWFPTITLQTPWFMSYIEQQDMLQINKAPPANIPLDIIRSISNLMNGTLFTWFPVIISLVFFLLRKTLCTKPHKPSTVIKKDNEWYQPVPVEDTNETQ